MALETTRRDHITAAVAVVVATGIALFAFQFVALMRIAENGVRDLVYMFAYPRAALSEDVVILAVTEDTLATLSYRSPIDRGFLAKLIETIEAHGPASIGVDILLDSATERPKDEYLRRTFRVSRSIPLVAAYPDEEIDLTSEQRVFLDEMLPPHNRGLAVLLADPDDGRVRNIKGRAGDVASLAFSMTGQPAPDGPEPIVYQFMDNPAEARFPIYPSHAAAALPAGWFAGKHVLIGAILPQTDKYQTPRFALLGGADAEPGVIIHAHALQQMLDGRSLRNLAGGSIASLTALAAILALAIMVSPTPVIYRACGIGALCIVFTVGAGLSLRYANFVLPIVPPVTASLISAAIIGGVQWRGERRQKAFIRAAFSRYVSPDVVNELIETPALLHRRPVRREATCIFTDVAGFTAMTERHKDRPETIEILLNEYLSGMASVFRKHGATLDKFIGDAVVGFFGGPIIREDHAAASLAMVAELDRFAEGFVRANAGIDGGFGHTRIGVHSGEVLIGNFGGDVFFDYTAIGDTVNTAARLESANKHFGTRVCVSDATLALAPGATVHRPIGRIVLKGKSEALLLHELVSETGDLTFVDDYNAAFDLLDCDPAAAKDKFLQSCTLWPGDRLAAFHLSRLLRDERGTLIELETK